MNNSSTEDILFIKSFFNENKKPEDFLKDIFLTLKIPPFRVVSNSKNKSKKFLTWDSNIKRNETNGKEVYKVILRKYIENFFKNEETRKYVDNNGLKLKPTSIKKYVESAIENLEILKDQFNEEILPQKVQENPETSDTTFKNYFYHLYLKNDATIEKNNENNIDLYEEYQKIVSSKDKKQVYNNIIFDSKNEAENFKEIFQPLLDNGVQVVLHQLYKDIIINTSSEHSMDFYIPDLKLIVESSSYNSKNESYYETMQLKHSLNTVSQILHETDNDFNFLLPKHKEKIPYSIDKKSLKDKIVNLLIKYQKELNINENIIKNIQSVYNYQKDDNRIIEKFDSVKHANISKQNSESISEENENLKKVNLGGIEINKEMALIKNSRNLSKINTLNFKKEEDKNKVLKFITILKLLIDKGNQNPNFKFEDIEENFINIHNYIVNIIFKKVQSIDKTKSILSEVFNFDNNFQNSVISYNSIYLQQNQEQYLKKLEGSLSSRKGNSISIGSSLIFE